MARVIEALAGIGAGTSAIGLIAVIVLAFKLVASAREQLAARDLLDKEREFAAALLVDRNGLKVELDSERTKTKVLADRLAVAEAQRNEAQRRERDHVIERIKGADVSDANRIVADLLSAPLADSVPQAVPRSAQLTSGDGLMDPSTV